MTAQITRSMKRRHPSADEGAENSKMPRAMKAESPPNPMAAHIVEESRICFTAGDCNTFVGQPQQTLDTCTLSLATAPMLNSFPTSMRLGGLPLKDLGLGMPGSISQDERDRRIKATQLELQRHREVPPVAPPSRVPDLPPKEPSESWVYIPQDMSEGERRVLEARNNDIAASAQIEDRRRNNMAAKKSRETRLEALADARDMLHQKTAECTFLRIMLISTGADPADWDNLPPLTRSLCTEEVTKRVLEIENERAEEKKRRDAKIRAERNKRRATLVKASNLGSQSTTSGSHVERLHNDHSGLDEDHGLDDFGQLDMYEHVEGNPARYGEWTGQFDH